MSAKYETVAEIIADRDSLRAEVAELRKRVPRCLGEWLSGSGGHRRYAGGCNEPGKWDVGLGFVCDEHINKNGADDDAWDWLKRDEVVQERDALLARVQRLEERLPINDEEIVSLKHFYGASRCVLCAYCVKAKAVIERILERDDAAQEQDK